MKRYFLYITYGVVLLVSSCGEQPKTGNQGAIMLGDSSTIVTEKDSQYLRDDVTDIAPAQKVAAVPTPSSRPEKPVSAVADTPATNNNTTQQTVSGHTISFGNTKIVLAGLQAKDARRQNEERDNGLTYALRSGNVAAAKLYVYSAKNVTIKQRYQSRLMLQSELGSVDLRDLGLYTSGWNTVSSSRTGNAAVFSLNSLNSIGFSQVNNNKIKNAADRELRKRRTNSRTVQNWMKEIRKIRTVNDKPCDVRLDNVQWQVSGTDASGKAFQKNIRLDAL